MSQDRDRPAPTTVGAALQWAPERGVTVAEGVRINWLAWGEHDAPLLVLVHGGAANAWWWSGTGPMLADDHRVVAVDLSGHGDSDRRDHYTFAGWADELSAVVRDLDSPVPAVIAGHSMGGIITSLLAQRSECTLGGLISIDSPLARAGSVHQGSEFTTLRNAPRPYPTREFAAARFRLVPDQDVLEPDLLQRVGWHSVMPNPEGQGWVWKFDPRPFAEGIADRPQSVAEVVARSSVPFGFIIGAKSDVVDSSDRELINDLVRAHGGPSCGWSHHLIDGAHHLMFDSPFELVVVLHAVLSLMR